MAALFAAGLGAGVFGTQVHAQAPTPAQAPEPAPARPIAQANYGPPAGPVLPSDAPAPPAAIPAALDEAAVLAALEHPLVGAAKAEARALGAELDGARWLRFPSLTVEGLAATQGSSIADANGLAANAVIEQPVWSGGRIGAEISRARAASAAGIDRVGEAQQSIVLEVTQAYYDFVLAAERVNVLSDSLAQHRQLIAAISRRVDQEVSPRADLVLGQSRTAQVELDLASAGELRDSAMLRLEQLTGGAVNKPTLPPAEMAAMLPPEQVALGEALACSPMLGALTDQVAAAEAQRAGARAALFPQVLLQLSQNEITGTRAAVVLRAQTGNGLSVFSAIDSSDARIQRALAEFGEQERRLRENLRREYVQLRASQARISAGVLASDAAAQIIESYQRQFIAGRRSWLDVMNAVREAADARLSESDARVGVAAGAARVLALSCRWQPGRGGEPS